MNERDFTLRLGANLKLLRQIHGFSQVDLANRLHIGRSTYSAFEKGDKTPPLFVCFNIAAIYGTTVEDLCDKDLCHMLKSLLN